MVLLHCTRFTHAFSTPMREYSYPRHLPLTVMLSLLGAIALLAVTPGTIPTAAAAPAATLPSKVSYGADSSQTPPTETRKKSLPLVVDIAQVLSTPRISQWEQELTELGASYSQDLVVVTSPRLGQVAPQDWADDFFDQGGYGIGADRSGAVLLIAVAERQLWLSTRGESITTFTDYGIGLLLDRVATPLADNDWDEGVQTFIDNLPKYLQQAAAGTPIDTYHYEDGSWAGSSSQGGGVEWGKRIGLAVLFILFPGFGVAYLLVRSMKKRHQLRANTANADFYIVPGSVELTQHQDRLINSFTTRRRIPPPSSGSNRIGGGSTTHIGSSGATHGGGGRGF